MQVRQIPQCKYLASQISDTHQLALRTMIERISRALSVQGSDTDRRHSVILPSYVSFRSLRYRRRQGQRPIVTYFMLTFYEKTPSVLYVASKKFGDCI
jgi:hypothetical protein